MKSRKTDIRKCVICESEFEVRSDSKTFTCSRKCTGKYRTLTTAKYSNCEFCGVKFKKSRFVSRFCSNCCARKFTSKQSEVKCVECGNVFKRVSCHVKENNFCSRECLNKRNKRENVGVNSPNYKRGYGISGGYAFIKENKTPKLLHRKVVENYIGRSLSKDEIVHHINGDKLDNRIENLQLTTRKEHPKLHSCK